MRSPWTVLAVILLVAIPCWAHVGSPDVYFQGSAGPYNLVVTIRTPQMIPGVATVEILSATPGISKITVVPLYIVGEGSKYPPMGDSFFPSKNDPQYFAGSIWLMASGSWQVRLQVEGAQGTGEVAIPVPAAARATLPMTRGLGILLSALTIVLVAAIIAIFGAARREAALPPGELPSTSNRSRAKLAMAVTAAIVFAVLVFGNWWWNSEASDTARQMIYSAPPLKTSLEPTGKLTLTIGDSRWHSNRPDTVMTALIPDHGYLMHLFLLREPGLDRFYHLHPVQAANGTTPSTFEIQLPQIEPGRYQVFADVVRASGFPDTMSAEIDIPAFAGVALTGDNSSAEGTQARPASNPSAANSSATSVAAVDVATIVDGLTATLPDGYRMVWVRGTQPLVANHFMLLRFQLLDPQGKPVKDAEPYMGMAGHAEIVSDDRSVFAHIHPEGSVAMAALALAQQSEFPAAKGPAANSTASTSASVDMPMNMPMNENAPDESSKVSFPYGFPKAGNYRLFVQMKRGGVIETGVFDTPVIAEPK